MKVNVIYQGDKGRPITDPLLEEPGFFVRWYTGDVCDPMNGKWFEPPWPTFVVRFCSRIPLPFVMWRFPKWVPLVGGRAGYAGFKAYGVDSPAYRNWIEPAEVFEGSQAMCTSIRPFASKM